MYFEKCPKKCLSPSKELIQNRRWLFSELLHVKEVTLAPELHVSRLITIRGTFSIRFFMENRKPQNIT